jgi:hypothetical protein
VPAGYLPAAQGRRRLLRLAVGAAVAAAFAVAIVVAFDAGHSDGSSAGAHRGTSAPPAENSGTSRSRDSAKAAPASPNSAPDVVRWHGTIGLNVDGSYLDDLPPKAATAEQGDIAYYSTSNTIDAYSNLLRGTISRWYGAGAPSRQQCSDLIDTHPSSEITDIHPGVLICVRTAQNRTAYIRVLDQHDDVADLYVTVWEFN